MFTDILVPLDRSPLAECVLPHALAIAQALDARIVLLHVMAQAGKQNGLRAVDPLEWHIHRAEAESYLQSVSERLQEAGAKVDSSIREGNAAEQILAAADEISKGLIIVSSHGQSGLTGWNISSVVQKIILRAHTSLLIIRAYQPVQEELSGLQYKRLLAPLDGSLRAECVLPLTSTLARAFGADVVAAHAVQRPIMPRRTPLSAEDNELAERVVESNRNAAESYLADVKTQLAQTSVETRLLTATNLASVLHELADQDKIDLVILSAHGYSGQLTWPYGSVVTSFISYGATPLLIFQDASAEQIAPTHAEVAMKKAGRR